MMVKIKNLAVIIFILVGADQSHGIPEWSKDAIWYQIFPERFRNGDKSNDPTIDTLDGTWPFEPVREWRLALGVLTGMNYKNGKLKPIKISITMHKKKIWGRHPRNNR